MLFPAHSLPRLHKQAHLPCVRVNSHFTCPRCDTFVLPYSVDSGLLTDNTPYKSVLGILIGWSCAQWDQSCQLAEREGRESHNRAPLTVCRAATPPYTAPNLFDLRLLAKPHPDLQVNKRHANKLGQSKHRRDIIL